MIVTRLRTALVVSAMRLTSSPTSLGCSMQDQSRKARNLMIVITRMIVTLTMRVIARWRYCRLMVQVIIRHLVPANRRMIQVERGEDRWGCRQALAHTVHMGLPLGTCLLEYHLSRVWHHHILELRRLGMSHSHACPHTRVRVQDTQELRHEQDRLRDTRGTHRTQE